MAARRILVDLGPLRRFPYFRRLWMGQLVSQLGSALTTVAVPYQVYRLTGSSFAVGMVSLAQLGPLLVGSLLGGSIADAFDRRKVLLGSQLALAGSSAGLAFNAMGGHSALWPLFAFPAVAAGLSGLDASTRTAAMVALVDTEALVSANALRQLLLTMSLVTGPAVAGLILARFGPVAVYWIDVASFAAAIAAFGLVSWLPAGLALLALAGAADVVSAVFRGTILQLETPDRLGGRLFSIQIAVVTGGPRLGDAEAGAVAALAGVRASVVSGGLACVVGAVLLGRLMPGFTNYEAPPERLSS